MKDNLISSKRGKIFNFIFSHKVRGNRSLTVTIGLFYLAAYYLAAQPIDIGNHRQVFIDKKFIAESKGIELTVHQPQKTGEFTINTDKSWEVGGIGPYSSVLFDDGIYHMWYHAMASAQWDGEGGRGKGSICYAKSHDGIHWEKPVLGLTEFGGNRENNIVMGHGAAGMQLGQDGGMVFIDPNAPKDQKFNFVMGRVDIYSSPDGILWKLNRRSVLKARPEERTHFDSQNVIFWDSQVKKYIAFGRRNLPAGRSIFRGEAENLDGFSFVQDLPVILTPDSLDLKYGKIQLVDYYMSAATKYPWADNAYYMFPTAYFHYIPKFLPEFKNEMPRNAGPLHTQFAASTDGINWERYDRKPFVPLGMKGEFDWASTRMFYGIVPALNGREIYMYYRASDWLHGWDRDERNKKLLTDAGLGAGQNIAVISRVVLRMDGFVSLRGAYTGGEFTTPLLKFVGGKLLLNVNTSATGIVRVEILDDKGKPLDGYSMEDCDRIHTTNEINRVVTWNGKSDVSGFAGRSIRLHFEIRDADLYAFQFKE